MKPYKFRRKQLEQRLSRKPKAIKNAIWTKAVKRVAMREYKYFDTDLPEGVQWDCFLRWVSWELNDQNGHNEYGTFQCDVYELDPYFAMFKACIAALKKKREKADYLKQNYVPLEEDLFHI